MTLADLVVLVRCLGRLEGLVGRRLQKPPAGMPTQQFILEELYGPAAQSARLPPLLASFFQSWSPEDHSCQLSTLVSAAWQAVPAPWRVAAVAAMPPATHRLFLSPTAVASTPAITAAVQLILSGLGWRWPPNMKHRRHVHMLGPGLTVRSATALQLAPVHAARHACHLHYAQAAMQHSTPDQPCVTVPDDVCAFAASQLQSHMRWLWRLRWDNKYKEILWRLTVNGVPAAGGHDISFKSPCVCGWVGPRTTGPGANAQASAFALRAHAFWECPVAKAVIGELARALPGHEIRCRHVWLLSPPTDAGLHGTVWAVVAMTALSAIARGRAMLWCVGHEGPLDTVDSEPHQSLISDFFPTIRARAPPAPSPSCVERVARHTAAKFWLMLQDFVHYAVPPPDWVGNSVPTDHPFIGVSAEGRLLLNLPPHYVLPLDIHD